MLLGKTVDAFSEAIAFFCHNRFSKTEQHGKPYKENCDDQKLIDDLTLSVVTALQLLYLVPDPEKNTEAIISKASSLQMTNEFQVMVGRLSLIVSATASTFTDWKSWHPPQKIFHLAPLGYTSYYMSMAEVKK